MEEYTMALNPTFHVEWYWDNNIIAYGGGKFTFFLFIMNITYEASNGFVKKVYDKLYFVHVIYWPGIEKL